MSTGWTVESEWFLLQGRNEGKGKRGAQGTRGGARKKFK